MAVKNLPLAILKTKPTLQPRYTTNFIIINEYAEAMEQGQIFPPLSVVWDGESYWLWDGYHRKQAAEKIGLEVLQTDVTEGSLQDAEWLALSANKTHGFRRSNEDKQRAVELAFEHPRSKGLSNRKLGEHIGVDDKTIAKYRNIIENRVTAERPHLHGNSYFRQGRDGKEYLFVPKPEPQPLVIECPVCHNQYDRERFGYNCPYCYKEQNNLPGWTEDLPEKMNGKNAVHFSSETPEWYTPKLIIDKLLELWRVIDLDPCSNSATSPNIPAQEHYTQEDDGLSLPWRGRVYMNPPYGNELADWVDKLVSEYEIGNISEAIALTPARTDTKWFRELRLFPRCFIFGRLKFSQSDNGAPFPSMVTYLGNNSNKFCEVFGEIGDIYILWQEAHVITGKQG